MKKPKRGIRRLLKIVILVLVVIPILIIIFISPIAKYLVEKYDVEYTGREITMDWAYVNPFTGYVFFDNLKILEPKKDTVFLSVKGVEANFEMMELLSGNYIISKLSLAEPRGVIVQEGKKLNLDDIIKKFSPDSLAKPKAPTHFSILSLVILNGEFHYREIITPINYFIKKVNIRCSGIRWDSDTIGMTYAFLPGVGTGDMKGSFRINTKNLDYKMAAVVHSFDLSFIQQYINDLVNYGTFRAHMDADIHATGNFTDARNLNAMGSLDIDDFHFGKDSTDDYASFDKLSIDVNQLNPENHKYLFDSLLLFHPICKYENYDSLDNIQVMFGEGGANVASVNANPQKFNLVIAIAKYIKKLSKEFLASYYQIKKFGIYKGDMTYSDFSLNEEFSVTANPLTVTADSIDKKNKRVKISFQSGCLPFGEASIFLSINPNDSGEFDMNYSFEKFSAAMFNPYLITYTSFPLDRGTIQLKGTWNVRNSFIQSENHLIILDPRVSKRVRKKDTDWMPVPLIMAFVRERGNVIDYEIPITGNLKNPAFHLKDVIMDLVKNIFVKPPTTPYRFEVKAVENTVEKALSMKWEFRQCCLYPHQEKFVEKLAVFLEENPNARISVAPMEYTLKEKEYILFFEAKKKYFLQTHNRKESSFSEKDSVEVDRMSNKDSQFSQYVNKVCHDTMLYTIQQQCYCFVGKEVVDQKLRELESQRKKSFLAPFKENGTAGRVAFMNSESTIPYNGYSVFNIKYKGELPDFLLKAYHKMDQLNEEEPRKKYFRLRKRNWRFGMPFPKDDKLSWIWEFNQEAGIYFPKNIFSAKPIVS